MPWDHHPLNSFHHRQVQNYSRSSFLLLFLAFFGCTPGPFSPWNFLRTKSIIKTLPAYPTSQILLSAQEFGKTKLNLRAWRVQRESSLVLRFFPRPIMVGPRYLRPVTVQQTLRPHTQATQPPRSRLLSHLFPRRSSSQQEKQQNTATARPRPAMANDWALFSGTSTHGKWAPSSHSRPATRGRPGWETIWRLCSGCGQVSRAAKFMALNIFLPLSSPSPNPRLKKCFPAQL